MSRLFLHILLKANFKDNEWRGQTIKRGQLITGRKQLSLETGLSEQTVRTCLERLKSTSEITSKSTSKYSIVTVCNYEEYQSLDNANQQSTSKLTNNQPATNQQLTSNQPQRKKVKKEKKEKKSTSTPEPQALLTILDDVATRSELQKKFRELDVYEELESMKDWLKQTGKKYKDYKAFARNWLRRSLADSAGRR